MMINGVSSYSPFTYASVSSTSSSDMTNGQQGLEGPPGGGKPHGPGGPKGGKPPKGPDLDTDKDGSWSKTEIEDFASYASEELGISLDVDEIMSKYDTDGDGTINSSERKELGKNNGLQLPPPEELQGIMGGQHLGFGNDENSYFSQPININSISIGIDAYNISKSYNEDIVETLFDTTA